MYKGFKNKKGFTLIELLAAIVILGVLMMVAIPAMTRYIENAKRDVFADTAKKYIASVRYSLLSDSFQCRKGADEVSCGLSDLEADKSLYLIIPCDLIDVENDTKKSPWGKEFDGSTAFVLVKNDGDYTNPEYKYSFIGTDKAGNGIAKPVDETSIGRSVVLRNGSSSVRNLGSTISYLSSQFGESASYLSVTSVK